ncbi:MAG: acyl-protein synthetase [Candidatus Eremiobacterota bacterium]
MPDAEEQDVRQARRILARRRGCTDTLLGGRQAFTWFPTVDRMFLRAMQEAFARHFLLCPLYREHCRQRSFVPADLKRVEDLARIPYLFVTILKRYRLLTGPEEKVRLTLTSSGTGGEKSATFLDGKSLVRVKKLVRHVYRDLGMVNRRRTNYLCFTYDPAVASDLGTAFSDQLLTGLTRVQSTFYAIRWRGEEWQLDRDGCLEALERFEASRRPLRILGFPAHAWEVLEECTWRRGRNFSFGPHSYVLTGGGWKSLQDREIPKPMFRDRVSEWLGIPRENVRDLYGMVEHGVPYTECEAGQMHVPRYSRVFVRHPGTLELLSSGQVGLYHFLTPYLNSYPAISLLTTDLGSVQPGCACGRSAPVLRLQGRGGVTKHKGCAINALEVL